MSRYTLGLCQIKVGDASQSGTMPGTMTKIGKTYKDTAKLSQANSDVTEHFEEGKAAPEIRKKSKKMPVLEFSIMDADAALLAAYIGGEASNESWLFDGDEVVANKAIEVEMEQGFKIQIPNADIEAVVDADLSAKGILLVKFTVTPCAVTSGKAFRCVPINDLSVTPTSLTFTASADSTGQTITASSTGNLTFAGAPSGEEWLTVTRSGKVATVKVVANPNSESRSAIVKLTADGVNAYVMVTQAGA